MPKANVFLKRIEMDSHALYCPAIVVTECAGAVARPTRNPALAKHTASMLSANPDITIVEITSKRAQDAGNIAADHYLRGADSLYVQVAQEYSAVLISWDAEMVKRAAAVVPVMTPADWLTANP